MKRTLLTAFLLSTIAFLVLHPLPPVFPQQESGEDALTDPDAVGAFADSLVDRGSRFRAAMEYERSVYLSPSGSAAPDQQDQPLLGFADHLFAGEHYYQAVTEYERFIYFNPAHHSVPRARLQIARCYKLGGQYGKALERYQELAVLYKERDEGMEAAFEAGDCLRLSENYAQALLEFSRLIQENPSHPLADKARWYAAWTHIWLQDYGSARMELALLNEGSRYQAPARELLETLERFSHLPRRSPLVSGMLAALVPGAGHLYTGQKKQALFSFVTNALLIFGSYEAFNRDLYTAGGFLSLFSINYYSGNIFGAITSAHQFNRRQREALLEEIMERYDE